MCIRDRSGTVPDTVCISRVTCSLHERPPVDALTTSVTPRVNAPGRRPSTSEREMVKDPTMQPSVRPRCQVSSGADGQRGSVAGGCPVVDPDGGTAACSTAVCTYWLSAAAWAAG